MTSPFPSTPSSQPESELPWLGIDLGTTFTKAALLRGKEIRQLRVGDTSELASTVQLSEKFLTNQPGAPQPITAAKVRHHRGKRTNETISASLVFLMTIIVD